MDAISSAGEGTNSMVDIIDNVFFFRWQFIGIFILITMGAVLYALIATPIYTADALIQVEEKKGTSLGALSQVANALGAQQSNVVGEIEILRSRDIIGRAVEKLQLNISARVSNRLPLIGNWLALNLERGPNGLAKPLWEGTSYAWGGERLRISEFIVPQQLVGKRLTLLIGQKESWELFDHNEVLLAKGTGTNQLVVGMDGALRIEIESLRARPGTKFQVVYYSLQSRINQLLGNLAVTETKRQSGIIRLAFQNANADDAAIILNTIADIYLKQNVSRRSEEAELSLKFLNGELPKLRLKLDSAERTLNEFRSKTKTMDISSEIKELLSKATLIEKAQLDLDLKRREYSERYDQSHPLMKSLNSQILGIKAESEQLTRQIGNLPIVQQEYIRLARDVDVNNQLYIGLLNNAQQLQIAKAGTTGNVAIVDRAMTPEVPTRPKRAQIVAVSAAFGLLLAFSICQVLAFMSKVVRDPRKLEHETNLPTLAILPLDEYQAIKQSNEDTFLLAIEKPNSASVEALRSLRTSLIFKLSEKPGANVVLITSAVPAQGKSFISVNLSYLFAASGRKTLLIEADIRLASISRYVKYDKQRAGLSTMLNEQVPPENAVMKDIFPNMDFLPSGPAVKNPGDLLSTDKLLQTIAALASGYDLVIIDSPPLLPVHDARSLGRAADITLFVARQDEVSVNEIHDAIDVFSKSGNTIDGIVYNAFVPSRIRYGYGYGGRYRNSSQYGGYVDKN